MNSALFSLHLLRDGGLRTQILTAVSALVVILCLPMLAVGAMGREAVLFLAATPTVEAASVQGFYTGLPVPGNTYAWGNCTYWAYAQRLWNGRPIPASWGNANTWDDRAKAQGYVVNHTPALGAVFQTDEGDYGHVAYVSEIKPDGSWVISEMNAPTLNVVSTRQFPATVAKRYMFIHDKL